MRLDWEELQTKQKWNSAFTWIPNIKGPKNYTVWYFPNAILRGTWASIISCQFEPKPLIYKFAIEGKQEQRDTQNQIIEETK